MSHFLFVNICIELNRLSIVKILVQIVSHFIWVTLRLFVSIFKLGIKPNDVFILYIFLILIIRVQISLTGMSDLLICSLKLSFSVPLSIKLINGVFELFLLWIYLLVGAKMIRSHFVINIVRVVKRHVCTLSFHVFVDSEYLTLMIWHPGLHSIYINILINFHVRLC